VTFVSLLRKVCLKPDDGDADSDQGTKTAKTGWLRASRYSRLDSIYVEGYWQGSATFFEGCR